MSIQALCPEAASWGRSDYERAIAREGRLRVVVALDGGTVVGFAVDRMLDGEEGELLNLAIHPRHRRKGLGKALVRSSMQRSRRLWLEVRAGNRAAAELYRGLGFAEVGRRSGYYNHPREDALILSCHRPRQDQLPEQEP